MKTQISLSLSKMLDFIKSSRLSFSHTNTDLEKEYLLDYNDDVINNQRLAIFLSIIAYVIFAPIDFREMNQFHLYYWFIRFGIYSPIALFVLKLSFAPSFKRYGSLMIAFTILLGGIGLLVIHLTAATQGFFSYRYALLFVLIFVYFFLSLRFVYVMMVGFVLFFVYNLSYQIFPVIPPDIHLDSNILYGYVIIFGAFSVYIKEKNHRAQFLLKKQLNDEKNKIASINDALEKKVNARTKELAYMSYHDFLTGLYNRRYLNQAFEKYSKINYHPLAIIIADINGLKLINDSFGHAIGDVYLVKVASILQKTLPEKAVVARLSGDEFAILSPNTDANEAEHIVQEVKYAISIERVNEIELSLSLGYGIKSSLSQDYESIMKIAEDSMYRKKILESPSMRRNTIHVILKTLHEKNKREEEHSQRVSRMAMLLGKAIGFSEEKLKELELIGLLHDIGKIGIDEKILNKEGSLTSTEYEIIKKHPEISFRILNTTPDMLEIASYVLYHHERWDGKGYPSGISGKNIPLQSRIIAIVDAYDAMTSKRSYRPAQSISYAIEELKQGSGSQFDPDLISVFITKILKNEHY